MLRRLAAVALVASAVVLGLPAVAAQAASVVVVVSASSPARNDGLLSVAVESTTPVIGSSIKAALFAPKAKKPALIVADFKLSSGHNTGGTTTTWTVASRITTRQLPLGSYRIEVKAASTGGDSANAANAGTLAFVLHPTLHVRLSSSATYSYGQDVTISGTDIGRYPSGAMAGLDGQHLTIVPGVTVSSFDHAGTLGYFSVTLQAGVGAGQAIASGVTVVALADKTTARASAGRVAVTVLKDQVQLSAAASPAIAAYGSSVAVTGTARYQIAGSATTLALTQASVQAAEIGCGGGPGCTYSATTGTSGGFTISGVPAKLPEQYSVSVAASPTWFTAPAATVTLQTDDVPVTVSLTAQAEVSGAVALTACAALPGPAGPAYDLAPFSPVTIRYSTSRSGPWTALATGSVNSGDCFGLTAPDQPSDYYYQADLAGNSQDSPAASASILATPPTESAIVHLGVAPRRLPKAGYVRVSGSLVVGHGRPGRHQKVQLLFRRRGSNSWQLLRTEHASHTGKFSLRAWIKHSGQLEVRYNGNAVTFACISRLIYLRV